MSLITLERIYKEYNDRVILQDVTLSVHRGERLALVGENGCGKTTLLKIAMKLEGAEGGNVIVGRNVRVGYLSQSMREIISSSSTAVHYEKVAKLEGQMRQMEKEMSNAKEEDQLRRYMEAYSKLTSEYEALDGYNIETKIKLILLGLGLREEALTIPVDKLSGGEKMRVALARILLEEPDLLILDEPTNHLDIKAVEWLENFLKNYKGGVLIVSHDRYFLDQVTTRIAELHNATIIERSGNYSTYIKQNEIRKEFLQKDTKRLQREIRQADALVQSLKSMRKINAANSRLKEKERLVKQYNQQKLAISTEHLTKKTKPIVNFKKDVHVSNNIAWANGLNKTYDHLTIFSNASFKIHGGEKVGIIGPNGCGKTTLLNILLGKDENFEGEAVLGRWVKYGYLGQEIIFEDEERTIMEELLKHKEMLEKEAKRYLGKYQFYGDEVYKQIKILSGGEKVRVYMATLMLSEPYCIIMDEPTNHLDMVAREALEKSLLQYKGTVIAISHDRYFLDKCVNKVLEIEDGKIKTYYGNYQSYKHQKEKEKNIRVEKTSYKDASKNKSHQSNNRASDKKELLEGIEEKIKKVEEEIKDIEMSFGPDADFKIYLQHEELSAKLNSLYFKWEKELQLIAK